MGLEPEDLMRLQPADVHRGQRSFTPREQAGHMTASTPSISVNFLLARRGPSTHGPRFGAVARPRALWGGQNAGKL